MANGSLALIPSLVGGFVRRVVGAVRRNGLRQAALAGARRAYARVVRKPSAKTTEGVGQSDAERFDTSNGVETAMSWRDWAGMAKISGSAWQHGHRYEGITRATLLEALRLVPGDLADYVFVDLGSGKGKALLVASELPFKRVVGVEYSPYLHEVALRNIAAYRSARGAVGDVQSICMDAAAYEFPEEPLVLFLFNPFDQAILDVVVDNLMRSLAQRPRPTYVVACRLGGKDVAFEQRGFVRIASTRDPIGEHHVLAAPPSPERG